jgi:hypothetical protein
LLIAAFAILSRLLLLERELFLAEDFPEEPEERLFAGFAIADLPPLSPKTNNDCNGSRANSHAQKCGATSRHVKSAARAYPQDMLKDTAEG